MRKNKRPSHLNQGTKGLTCSLRQSWVKVCCSARCWWPSKTNTTAEWVRTAARGSFHRGRG